MGNPLNKIARAAKVTGFCVATLSLSGCLLTSPYWNQEFSDHTKAISLQAFTTDSSKSVKFECAQAFHGGLYPYAGSETWNLVGYKTPQNQPLFDPLSSKIYGASRYGTLPASCWRKDPGNQIWYAAIRATQGSGSSLVTYKTFAKSGLECLGRENGKAASWFGWISKGCTQTYSGSSTEIPYVIFRATS